jgi:hypothetical protein
MLTESMAKLEAMEVCLSLSENQDSRLGTGFQMLFLLVAVIVRQGVAHVPVEAI